jgi:fused signal recognition particle receptor
MEELRKMRRVMDKQDVQRVRTLLVLDATTGQNALSQGRTFAEASGVDGLVVAKLDGTAKGGIIFPLVRELQAPVLFVGTGEKLDDLSIFEPRAFVRALFRDAARV